MADTVKFESLVDIDHLSLYNDKIKQTYATKAEHSALSGRVDDLVTAGGEPNVIEGVKVNDAAVAPVDKVVSITVPTAVADLSDASDYAKAADLGTAAAANVESAVADDAGLPTGAAVKSFVEGKGYQTASDVSGAIAGKANAADLGTAAAAATESALTDGANLPTGAAVKSFVEGKGYQTSAQVEAAIAEKGYQTASDVSAAINAAVASAMDYKGSKAAVADLPASGNKKGDVWHVAADGSEYAWDGAEWQELGVTVSLSGYAQEADFSIATNAQVNALFE